MAFVLDASVVLDWAFGEGSAVADAAASLLEDEDAIVPALHWFEVRNALIMGERRGRLTRARTTTFLAKLTALPLTTDRAPDETALLDIARLHQLTAYDAAYLELAVRRAVKLASLDRALRAASEAIGVALVAAA